jgi:lipopolysaccharide transport system ATP-binding protein
MSNWIIQTEGLGKKYPLRHLGASRGYVTLREAVVYGFKRLLQPTKLPKSASEDFWALRDLSFRVKESETVAIIGRNGAGKSTLLKILSRITEPSEGRVRLKGRVASLLEVGTGFHPELTGRENIYLNGTILGMSKREVDRKFDAIVDFSGVERFVDTPVKHFSSGMQVRLAFAVAAHLEPEILVIDEVLAVGDAVFQKRCLGKMQDVAADGRTVLFVSHDLAAVEKLCSRAILLEGGRCRADGPTAQTIAAYQASIVESSAVDLTTRKDRRGAGVVRFTRIQLLDENCSEQSIFLSGKPIRVRMHYHADGSKPLENCRVSLTFNGWGKIYFVASTELVSDDCLSLSNEGFIDCIVEELPLSLGTYYLGPFIEVNGEVQDWLESAATLEVEDGNFYGTGRNYPQGGAGATVLVKHRWHVPTKAPLNDDPISSGAGPSAIKVPSKVR